MSGVRKTFIMRNFISMSDKSLKDTKLFKDVKSMLEEQVIPFMRSDGGDMELVDLIVEGKYKILEVRLHGACHGCAISNVTLQQGVQASLDQEFPDEYIFVERVS